MCSESLSDTALLGVMLCPIAPHRPAELLYHPDLERGHRAYGHYDDFGIIYETFWIGLILVKLICSTTVW